MGFQTREGASVRLPVAIWEGEQVWTDAELRAPSPATIANTVDAFEKGTYRGVVTLLAGCVTAFEGGGQREADRNRIAALVRKMPYASAEPLGIYALLENDPDDGIEGVYDCPRCGKGRVICEHVSDEEDTRDHIRSLPVMCQVADPIRDKPVRTFAFTLSAPVQLTEQSAAGDPPMIASSFMIRYPTLGDCIEGEAQTPGKASMRQEISIRAIGVEIINGEPMSPGALGTLARTMIEGMPKGDFRRLGEQLGRYGIASMVKKTCPVCAKVFDVRVVTSNFFASALVS